MSQRAVGLLRVKMKFISLLLLFWFEQIQGSTDIIQLFLPTGVRSLINFQADGLSKDFVVSLLYNLSITIGTCRDGDPKPKTNFTGNVEPSCPASLIFPSPQTSDSGVYSARVTGDKSKMVNYNVTFQDPVSPVELKVDVISKSPYCLKVTCRTEDDEINGTLIWVDKSYRLEGGERSKVTKSGASLRLYQSNESIICNHSNQVSSTQNKEDIQPFLRSEDHIILIVAISIGVGVPAIIGGVLCLKKRQTGSSKLQKPLQPLQVNGHPRSDPLMEAEESAV